MSVTALNYEPIHLITVVWPGGTYYVTNAGGDVTWNSVTWQANHATAGLVQSVGTLSETSGEIANTELVVSVTDTTRPWIASGLAQRVTVTIREAARDNATGVLTVQSSVWTGKCDDFSWSNDGMTILLRLAHPSAFDRLPDSAVVYGPSYQDTLVAGDTAFDLTGGRVSTPFTDIPILPGAPGNGIGGYVDANSLWPQYSGRPMFNDGFIA
jgi:hypothetical protein